MITSITLDDATGAPVTLHETDTRCVTRASGLLGGGVAAPRDSRRVRPQAHGGIDDTTFTDGKIITLDCEVSSPVSPAAAQAEFRALAAVMQQTLDVAPAWLKWAEGTAAVPGLSLQRKVKLMGEVDPPLEGGAAMFDFVAQFFSEDPRAYAQVASAGVGTALSVGSGGLTFATSGSALSNLIRNPSAELSALAEWDYVSAGTVFTRATAGITPPVGSAAFLVNSAGVDSYQGTLVTLDVGQWTFSGWVKNDALTGAGDGAGLQSQAATGSATGLGLFGFTKTLRDWTRISQTITVTSPGTFGFFMRAGNGAITGQAWFDGLQLVKGPTLIPYFDGENGGSWTGAPHASASVKDIATAGGGLIFPFKFAPSSGGTLSVTTGGTKPTPPTFKVYGYARNFSIVLLNTGERISFGGSVSVPSAEVTAGNYLEIDVANRTVLLNGDPQQNRRNLLNPALTTWFELPAATTCNFQMVASDFDASARVDVIYRDAY